MTTDEASKLLDGLLEQLATVEHERWSHWQRYMHGKGAKQSDGSLLIPPDLVKQWERQFATPYGDLTDKEKESDREQVRKYLPVIADALSNSGKR
jgi:hypothetical protein